MSFMRLVDLLHNIWAKKRIFKYYFELPNKKELHDFYFIVYVVLYYLSDLSFDFAKILFRGISDTYGQK